MAKHPTEIAASFELVIGVVIVARLALGLHVVLTLAFGFAFGFSIGCLLWMFPLVFLEFSLGVFCGLYVGFPCDSTLGCSLG